MSILENVLMRAEKRELLFKNKLLLVVEKISGNIYLPYAVELQVEHHKRMTTLNMATKSQDEVLTQDKATLYLLKQ